MMPTFEGRNNRNSVSDCTQASCRHAASRTTSDAGFALTESSAGQSCHANWPGQSIKFAGDEVIQHGPCNIRGIGFGGTLCDLVTLDAVEEYLNYHGLDDTVSALRAHEQVQTMRSRPDWCNPVPNEPKDSKPESPKQPPLGGEIAVAHAMRHFDEGSRESFFEIWNEILRTSAAKADSGGSVVELRVRVHFGTHAVRRSTSAASREIVAGATTHALEGSPGLGEPDFNDLKAFLATHPAATDVGEDASGTSEHLQALFALPYVPSPQTNPGLTFIFEEEWLQRLRCDVLAFLTAHAAARHAPTLRHLAGNALAASHMGPQAVPPPPACWHELVRIADIGLAALSRAGLALGRGLSGAAAAVQWRLPKRGYRPSEGFMKEIDGARCRLVAVFRKQPEAVLAALADPPLPNSGVRQPPREVEPESIPALHNVGIAVGPAAVSPPVCHGRLWPMSREAVLRTSSASDLDVSRSPVSRRLHSARSLDSRARTATALLPVPPALDFGRIAAVIAGDTEEDCWTFSEGCESEKNPPSLPAVLRAVLRRLALPDEPIRPRRAFLAAFACFGALRALVGRLGEVVASGDAELLELSLAIVAVCACEVVGRREIEMAEAQRPLSCITALVILLRREPISKLSHMLCLAALQRLSLRSQLQLKMIELGTIDWILENIRGTVPSVGSDLVTKESPGCCWSEPLPASNVIPGSTPEFSIEFASALLMNLTLRNAGRKRCADLGAYSTLIKLVEHPNTQVRTHVNGTLYALLASPSFRATAIQQGANDSLRAALTRVPSDSAANGNLLSRQLEYLLEQLGAGDSDAEDDGQGSEQDADAGAECDADDCDNFLDEEELVGHFLLAPVTTGATAVNTAAVESSAGIDSAAAEEALRRFRVTPAVADVQQRRFHAFVARSCRGLLSPKRRIASRGGLVPVSGSPLAAQPPGRINAGTSDPLLAPGSPPQVSLNDAAAVRVVRQSPRQRDLRPPGGKGNPDTVQTSSGGGVIGNTPCSAAQAVQRGFSSKNSDRIPPLHSQQQPNKQQRPCPKQQKKQEPTQTQPNSAPQTQRLNAKASDSASVKSAPTPAPSPPSTAEKRPDAGRSARPPKHLSAEGGTDPGAVKSPLPSLNGDGRSYTLAQPSPSHARPRSEVPPRLRSGVGKQGVPTDVCKVAAMGEAVSAADQRRQKWSKRPAPANNVGRRNARSLDSGMLRGNAESRKGVAISNPTCNSNSSPLLPKIAG